MELPDYHLLFHWCIDLGWTIPVWDVSGFIKTFDWLLDGEIASTCFQKVSAQTTAHRLLTDESFHC